MNKITLVIGATTLFAGFVAGSIIGGLSVTKKFNKINEELNDQVKSLEIRIKAMKQTEQDEREVDKKFGVIKIFPGADGQYHKM